ncbi:flagellar biosynthesis repressor FlbT [Pararhodospirillum photometricum]|uniref:flagellar biosynthesis repressor FlbT n=1 Tax=Pararhodospirillum photometricum TaxID=1084 RepID=UPI000314386F|nr:flagellar biosynthesis repressor FlbT [Pararhodospirillum photometricum]
MPLKVTLRPNEKILIGTAVVANGPTKAELVILNRVPVLRQKDILTEEQADTVTKKLYHVILNMYISPQNEKAFHRSYFSLVRKIIELPFDGAALDLIHEISQCVIAGDHYRALKVCRNLIESEEEILGHGQGSREPSAPAGSEPARGGSLGLHEGGVDAGRRPPASR